MVGGIVPSHPGAVLIVTAHIWHTYTHKGDLAERLVKSLSFFEELSHLFLKIIYI